MSSKFPIFTQRHEPWVACQNCGFDVPWSMIRLHRRFGWLCTGYPGANCWDGGPQKDEIFYTPRPYEGTRKTAAPITGNFHAGWVDGDFIDNAVYGGIGQSGSGGGQGGGGGGGGGGGVVTRYIYDQGSPTTIYQFTFGKPFISFQ